MFGIYCQNMAKTGYLRRHAVETNTVTSLSVHRVIEITDNDVDRDI